MSVHGGSTYKARAQLAAVLRRFEMDVRRMVALNLLAPYSEEALPSVRITAEAGRWLQTARKRMSRTGGSYSILGFLEMDVCVGLLLNNRELLPESFTARIGDSGEALRDIMSIRHRALFGRPVLDSDLPVCLTCLASFETSDVPFTHHILDELEKGQLEEPTFELQRVPLERVMHNLPSADHTEGAIASRAETIGDVIEGVGRHRMTAVSGGEGASELALAAAYALVDAERCPVQQVLWASLGCDTSAGGGRSAVEKSIDELGKAVDVDFSGGLPLLADRLDEARTLMILDQAEQAGSDELTQLCRAMPTNVAFLLVSLLDLATLQGQFPLLDIH